MTILINPGDGGGGPTDPPLLYFYAPRVNETKLILFASWVFLKYHLEKISVIKKSRKRMHIRAMGFFYSKNWANFRETSVQK